MEKDSSFESIAASVPRIESGIFCNTAIVKTFFNENAELKRQLRSMEKILIKKFFQNDDADSFACFTLDEVNAQIAFRAQSRGDRSCIVPME
jgi:hypothetical protein